MNRRELAGAFCRLIMASVGDDLQPGVAIVILANERPGEGGVVEIDVATECGHASTLSGGLLLVELAKRVNDAVKTVANELAVQRGGVTVDRPDLALHVTGGRPKG